MAFILMVVFVKTTIDIKTTIGSIIVT